MTKPIDLSFTIDDLDKAMSKVKSTAGESKIPPTSPSQKTFYHYVSGVERKRLLQIDEVLHGFEDQRHINDPRTVQLQAPTELDD